MLILIFILLFNLLQSIVCQTEVLLTQPPNIECSNFQITINDISYSSQKNVILTYLYNYTVYPSIALSINTFDSFQLYQKLSYINQLQTITSSYANISYTLLCSMNESNCDIMKLKISYIIYDDQLYYFVHFISVNLTINSSIALTHQYYEVQYLAPLDDDQYNIECSISGFRGMEILGMPFVQIEVFMLNHTHYIFGIQYQNMNLTQIYYTKVMLNMNQINNQINGIDNVDCQCGTAYHYLDPLIINQNESPNYLPFAMFFGIKKFNNWNFSIDLFIYIFNNSVPPQEINIAYTLFKTKACPSNQLYVSSQNLCYGLSNAFYYQVSSQELVRCPYSCYQCIGPLSTNCKSCLQGHNRELSGGRCNCISGFYDPGSSICKNCTEAISGCKTCSSATNCIQCLANCTAIGFNPIYCDCPMNVQVNSSYNCQRNYYFQSDTNTCQCLVQTYYNPVSLICQACAFGCYVCKSLSICIQCIDAYIMVNHTCIYFYLSYALVGQISYINSPQIRCLRFDRTGTCLQRCLKYYYKSICYGACPVGTFNISFPWLTCQPCKQYCQMCFNFTICYLCSQSGYYFNSSILSCSPCSYKCDKCTNASICLSCYFPYKLLNGQCIMEALPTIICSYPCTFCLLNEKCLSCQIPYYLNESQSKCIECLALYGLRIGSNGCYQICGDGLSINSECDDGNLISGDGCDSTCNIQRNYSCKKLNNKSYCWNSNLLIKWSIYSKFLQNKLLIKLYSTQINKPNINPSIQCHFNYTLISITPIDKYLIFQIQYKQSLLQYMYFYSYKRIFQSNSIKKSLCIVNINMLENYYVYINHYPEPLYQNDYSKIPYSLIKDHKFISVNSAVIFTTTASLLIGLSATSSFLTHRFYTLLYFTYQDAYQMPINSYSQYPPLLSLLFISSNSSTEELISYNSNNNKMILFKTLMMYIGLVVWIQLILRLWVKTCKNMDWKFLIRIFGLIERQKALVYQAVYISYQLIILRYALQTMMNIRQSPTDLIFLASFHILIYLGTKIHFYFNFENLQIDYPGLAYYFLIEQIQNITLSIFIQSSIQKGSFICILIIIFSVISLLAITNGFYNKLKINSSKKTTFYLFRAYLYLQIIIQVLKQCNWLRGTLNMDQVSNQEISLWIGLILSYLIGFGVILGGTMNIIVIIIWLKEVRMAGMVTIPSKLELNDNDLSANAL